MGNAAKRTVREAASAEKHRHALELRKAGASYAEIGKALGFTSQRAHQIIKEELAGITEDARNELVKIETARLDAMLLALWDKVKKCDVACIDAALRISTRRSKMLGLDAPTKTAHSGRVALVDVRRLTDDELQQLVGGGSEPGADPTSEG